MLVGSSEASREELELLSFIGDSWGSCAPFDELAHGETLKELWHTAFGESVLFERRSIRWTHELGFQDCDPVTDLRGIGVTGLAHLLSFCKSGAGAVVLRKVSRGVSTFPLACASLNVSRLLCAHLRLCEPHACDESCSLETLKNATRLQLSVWLDSATVDDDDGFEPLASAMSDTRVPRQSLLALFHAELLRRLFDRWDALTHADPSDAGAQMLRHFPSLLNESREHMQRTLAMAGPWDLRAVLVGLRGADGDGECALVAAWAHWANVSRSCPPSLYRIAAAALASLIVFSAPANQA